MARKDTIASAIRLMANTWKFPGTDLQATAEAYHSALSDLSDKEVADAVSRLLASWDKVSPPKPADIRRDAAEYRPLSKKLPPVAARERSHDETLHHIRCTTYAARVIAECGLRDKHPDLWTREEWLRVSKAQAAERQRLGIPYPDISKTPLREKWADT